MAKYEKRSQIDENDWAFVDIQGAIVPQETLLSHNDGEVKNRFPEKASKVASKEEHGTSFEVIDKNGIMTTSGIIATTSQPPLEKAWCKTNKERKTSKKNRVQKIGATPHENGGARKIKLKKKTRKRRNEDDELDFEVIEQSGSLQNGSLTTSTIIATTTHPPLEKNYEMSHDDLEYPENQQRRSSDCSFMMLFDQHSDDDFTSTTTNEFDDTEFIQIPEPLSNNPLDTSSSSVEVVSEKQGTYFDREDEAIAGAEDDSSFVITSMNFPLDLPTLAALFCLTTALGFVIGHGIGIATTVLVVKTPEMKIPPAASNMKDFGKNLVEEERNKEDINLDEKLQKWKSMYRKDREKREDSPATLKEAHKRLSLENFELKQTQSKIEKELDLMKTMSWYRRSQIENLKEESKENRSQVVSLMKKELEYLEEVYKKEKKMADLWRNEEEEWSKEQENIKASSWQKFKEGWNELHKETRPEGEMDEWFCQEKGTCSEENRDHKTEIEMNLKNTKEERENTQEGSGRRKREIQDGSEEEQMTPLKGDMGDILDLAGTQGKSEEHNEESHEKLSEDGLHRGDEGSLVTIEEDGGGFHEAPAPTDQDTYSGNTGTRVTTEGSQSWYNMDILKIDNDVIMTYENKDDVTHKLYGFWNGKFSEIISTPGDLSVLVMTNKSCGDEVDEDLVVSVQNDSPETIVFFAVFPDGRIRHQEIGDRMQMSMTYMAKKPEGEVDNVTLYEATVTEEGEFVMKPARRAGVKEDATVNKPSDEQSISLEETSASESSASASVSSGNENIEIVNNDEIKSRPIIESEPDGERVSEDYLQPGEMYLHCALEHTTYRRLVSSHRYAISEFMSVVRETPKQDEQVFYRFPGHMMMEKIVVKELGFDEKEEQRIKADRELKVGQCGGQHFAKIIDEMLHKRWIDGEDQTILMWYDQERNTVVKTSIALSTVPRGRVLSHELLASGSKVSSGNTITMTSYIVNDFDIVRVTRTDVTQRIFTPEADTEEKNVGPCFQEEDEETKVMEDFESEGGNTPFEQKKTVSDVKNEERQSGFVESMNSDGVFNIGEDYNDYEEGEPSVEEESQGGRISPEQKKRVSVSSGETFVNSEEVFNIAENDEEEEDVEIATRDHDKAKALDTGNGLCGLALGETQFAEYLTVCEGRRSQTSEKVERVMLTELFQEEDLAKLDHTRDDVEEAVSYVYCGDGSVEKTWQRTINVEQDCGGSWNGGVNDGAKNGVGLGNGDSLRDDGPGNDESENGGLKDASVEKTWQGTMNIEQDGDGSANGKHQVGGRDDSRSEGGGQDGVGTGNSGTKAVGTENGLCGLALGETQFAESLTVCQGGKSQTSEKVERVMLTESFQEEDLAKLDHTTDDVEETVSYVYCGDDSVEKTWQRTVNIKQDGGGSGNGDKNGIESGNGEPVEDNRSAKGGSGNDGAGNSRKNDGKEESIETKDSEIENGEDHDGHHQLGGYEHETYYYDDYDDGVDYNHGNNADDGDDYGDDGENDDDDGYFEYDDDGDDDGDDYGEYDDGDGKDMQTNDEHGANNKDHESPSNAAELQEMMIAEWERIKDEYRQLENSLKTAQEESEVAKESERRWQDMRFQQQQFDAWKNQALDELKNNLKNEWEKLRKRQEEIVQREKQLEVKRDAFLQTYNKVAFEFGRNVKDGDSESKTSGAEDREWTVSESWPVSSRDRGVTKENKDKLKIDEKLSAAWELSDISRKPSDQTKMDKEILTLTKTVKVDNERNHEEIISTTKKGDNEGSRGAADKSRADQQKDAQMEILREKLDELYVTNFGKTKNEVQVSKPDQEESLADLSVGKTNVGHDSTVIEQPKCPMKCPRNEDELPTSESNMEAASSERDSEGRSEIQKDGAGKTGWEGIGKEKNLMDRKESYHYPRKVGVRKEGKDAMDRPLQQQERKTEPLGKWRKMKKSMRERSDQENEKQRKKRLKKFKGRTVRQDFLETKKRQTRKERNDAKRKVQGNAKKSKISGQRRQ